MKRMRKIRELSGHNKRRFGARQNLSSVMCLSVCVCFSLYPLTNKLAVFKIIRPREIKVEMQEKSPKRKIVVVI